MVKDVGPDTGAGVSDETVPASFFDVPPKESIEVKVFGGGFTIFVFMMVTRRADVTVVAPMETVTTPLEAPQALSLPVNVDESLISRTGCSAARNCDHPPSGELSAQSEHGIACFGGSNSVPARAASVGSANVEVTVA